MFECLFPSENDFPIILHQQCLKVSVFIIKAW